MDPVDSVDSVTQTEQKQSTTSTSTSTQPPGLHSFQRPAFQSAGLHSEQWEPAPCPRVSGARPGGANVCRVVPVQSAVFSASADARSAAFSAEQLLAGQLVQRGAG